MEEWNEIKKELKPRFAAAEITSCEARLAGCWRDNGLTWMHRKKRRYCDRAELYRVSLACVCCHDKIESMSHEAMFNAVNKVIQSRSVQP